MKVKLLKKVRKRYEIVKVVKNDNPNSYMYGRKVPFFVVREIGSWYREYLYDEYESARQVLLEMIRKDYSDKMNKKERYKEVKVWHV